MTTERYDLGLHEAGITMAINANIEVNISRRISIFHLIAWQLECNVVPCG